ncbi:alpha/beta fold hydrolase [Albitalea terrae]|uniref:Alpha/beta fold hydrolase n=2 Tax=Piscinibacter terrae TaxID=2496871 RepID=A0A3N7IYG0_9BURK|nr:alpha/beta fold hydrolase [Albitalea terrae]
MVCRGLEGSRIEWYRLVPERCLTVPKRRGHEIILGFNSAADLDHSFAMFVSHRGLAPMNSRRPSTMPRLLLFHGLASSSKEFGLLVHPLRRAGVRFDALDVNGYTHGTMPDRARWQDWVDAACARVDAVLDSSNEPIVLGGLCTGAMLALAVASRRRHAGLVGLALLSPLFSYDGWSLPWWYGFRHLAYLLRLEHRYVMRERSPFGLKNERMRQMVRTQLQDKTSASVVGPAEVSLQVVRESERLSAHARSVLAGLHLPTLALHARDDEICRLASVRQALASMRPESLQLKVLENSYHMITADNDRKEVADELAAFVRSLSVPASRNSSLSANGKPLMVSGASSV